VIYVKDIGHAIAKRQTSGWESAELKLQRVFQAERNQYKKLFKEAVTKAKKQLAQITGWMAIQEKIR
jgi:hypothetical protein